PLSTVKAPACFVRPIIAAIVVLAISAAGRAEDWKLAKEQDGVKVWSRHVAGSAVHKLRVVAKFSVPAERVFSKLRAVATWTDFVPLPVEVRQLGRDAESATYYMVIDPPWVSGRDYCIRVTPKREQDGQLKIEWTIEGRGCPDPKPSLVRMARNEGFWQLAPL